MSEYDKEQINNIIDCSDYTIISSNS